MVPCLFTCMFQVQYYLMDFDNILYEHILKPVLFNVYRICDNKNMAETQKCKVWATVALLSKCSNHYDQRNIGTKFVLNIVNTLKTGDANLRFYIKTAQDGWRKSAFLTRACFPCTIHLIMKYMEPVSEWSCWRVFIETWPHSEFNPGERAFKQLKSPILNVLNTASHPRLPEA